MNMFQSRIFVPHKITKQIKNNQIQQFFLPLKFINHSSIVDHEYLSTSTSCGLIRGRTPGKDNLYFVKEKRPFSGWSPVELLTSNAEKSEFIQNFGL